MKRPLIRPTIPSGHDLVLGTSAKWYLVLRYKLKMEQAPFMARSELRIVMSMPWNLELIGDMESLY